MGTCNILNSIMMVKAFSAVMFSALRYMYTPKVAIRMRGVDSSKKKKA
jgi:hypothetical protein